MRVPLNRIEPHAPQVIRAFIMLFAGTALVFAAETGAFTGRRGNVIAPPAIEPSRSTRARGQHVLSGNMGG